MKILVTGSHGQLGWELVRSLQALGDVKGLCRAELDLIDTARVSEVIRSLRPDVIVNAAAYTAVDQAEDEPDLASLLNESVPAILAEESARSDALLVHFSTDYVFDGSKSTAYVEDDVTKPVNVYGRTKLAGEQAVMTSGAEFLIIRTSWLYGVHGSNFVNTILRLAASREELNIVNDQAGTPTWVRMLADAAAHIVRISSERRGQGEFDSELLHLTNAGKTTWYSFADEILRLARASPLKGKLAIQNLLPISTEEYAASATRPCNSCLDNSRVQARFGIALPDWRTGLALCFEDLVAHRGV